MKTIYLINKQVDGIWQLAIATQEEWDAILKENRRLPLEKRRLFIKDCFEDNGELDCMYIETTAAGYRAWNSKNTVSLKKRKLSAQYTYLSLDSGVPETGIESLHESIPSDLRLEELVTDRVLMEELRRSLRTWKPWAEELMELYIAGAKRSCTRGLCEKYQLSDRAVRKRKEAFEKFVLDFLKK